MPVPYCSHRPAHTSRMFLLQSALLGQPVLLQPDTESLLIGAVLAGDQLDAQVLRLAVCKLYQCTAELKMS